MENCEDHQPYLSPAVSASKWRRGSAECRKGAEGASYRIVVTEKGFLDLVDVGRGSSSSWGIFMNGSIFRYEGEGRVTLTFLENGSFQAAGSNSGWPITAASVHHCF